MRKGYIYIIKNYCNKKVYIGQTIQSIQERFRQHMKPSTIKKKGSYKIYNAIAKYGKENFYVELLEETTPDKLDEREIFYIEKFDSYKNGYNSTNGGDTKTICKVQDIDKLKEMFNDHKTFKEMSEYFGVNKATIQRTLHSIGLRRKNKISKEFLLENQHLFNYQIAKIFDVCEDTVSRAFKKYGIPRGKGCNNYKNKQNQKKCND